VGMINNSIESGSDPSTFVGEYGIQKYSAETAHGPDPGTLPANRLISPAHILGLRAGSLVYRINDNS